MFCISKQTISTPTVEIDDFREVSLRPTEEVIENETSSKETVLAQS